MTPKQIEKLRANISNIKKTLTAEKRKFGDYDDSRGLRYIPPKYFVQLGDYKEGLTYLEWFEKEFHGDTGFPDFLFEWTIILFKCGKLKEAAKKVFETYCSNTYLFDKFFGRPIIPIDKYEGSNLEWASFTKYFEYSSKQPEFTDFSEWLDKLIKTDDFESRCDKYIDIYKRLKTEHNFETRHNLIMQANQLIETV
jgi:hypothetical protein